MEIEYMGEALRLDVTGRYKLNPSQVIIQAYDSNNEPFATLTKCLPDSQILNDETIIDEPNVPGILETLVKSGFVEKTEHVVEMGFNFYPIVKLRI